MNRRSQPRLRGGGGERNSSFLQNLKNNKYLLLMLAPAVIYTFIFNYLPMGGIVLAFKKYNYKAGVFGSPWNGLENFKYLFVSGKFGGLVLNTFLYNCAFILVTTVVQVLLAIMISELTSRLKKVYQTLLFLPYFISWVVVRALLMAMFGYETGLVNNFFASIGLSRLAIYTTAEPWPGLLVFLYCWKSMGYGSVVYLATITGIDSTLYEAADLDGASFLQRIRYIVLPSLRPTVIIMTLLALGSVFRGQFMMFYQLIGQNAVALEVADTLDLFVYRALISSNNIGQSSAAGFLQSVLCLVTVLLANWGIKKYDPDYSLF